MGQLPDHAKGLLITVLGVLILTPDSLLVRLISTDIWTLLFWRGLLTSMALAAWLAATYRRQAVAKLRATGLAGLCAAMLFGATTVCFITALKHTSVANTLVIVSAAPLFAALMARLFLHEAVARRTWLAILAALCGILVLVSGSFGGGRIVGDLAALATAALLAGSLTVMRRYRDRNMVPAMAISGLFVAMCAFPLGDLSAVTARDAIWLGLLGLLVLPVSFGLMALGPRYLPAPEVSLILLLETVLGPFWVWLVLGEEPGMRAFIGGAIVISALVAHAVVALMRPAVRRETV